ncbi:hypothetical protein D6833_07005 [Candidatus Parcubacteria bacterium]|nr:MAG: hypothetical protein D6833_07005 [Candidatus Parcubacteria bacterium]
MPGSEESPGLHPLARHLLAMAAAAILVASLWSAKKLSQMDSRLEGMEIELANLQSELAKKQHANKPEATAFAPGPNSPTLKTPSSPMAQQTLSSLQAASEAASRHRWNDAEKALLQGKNAAWQSNQAKLRSLMPDFDMALAAVRRHRMPKLGHALAVAACEVRHDKRSCHQNPAAIDMLNAALSMARKVYRYEKEHKFKRALALAPRLKEIVWRAGDHLKGGAGKTLHSLMGPLDYSMAQWRKGEKGDMITVLRTLKRTLDAQ